MPSPIFWTRRWVSRKGTHTNNFLAGEDLQEHQWVKEDPIGSYNVIGADFEEEAIGFVTSPKGALLGERVDVLLGEWRKAGGSTPIGPVVVVAGCPGPTDDNNLGYVVGSLWFDSNRQSLWVCEDPTIGAAVWTPQTNFRIDVIAPTAADDSTQCYFEGYFWFDEVGQNFYVCVDDTAGAAIWFPINSGDVLIGRTLHVAINGNDGTAVPNSLVHKYLTISAAIAASTQNDTIYVWPGVYTLTASETVDGTRSSRFHFEPGAAVLTPPAGNPAFLINANQRLQIRGNSIWLCRDMIFKHANPSVDIAYVDFECDVIAQFGIIGFIGDITSIRGNIEFNSSTDLAITCDGWCDVNMAVDSMGFTGSAVFRIANITNNNGVSFFNPTYGASRYQLRGRSGKYAKIEGAYGPGFLDGVFYSGTGGSRDDRHVKICADVYVFDGAGFRIAEGTWVWEGSGFMDKDPPATNDQWPFFLFNEDNNDFYFEHRMGSVNSLLDNTVFNFTNNGTVKLSGNYYCLCETYVMGIYTQANIGSRLILDGDFQTAGFSTVFEFNDQALGTPFLPVFKKATVYSQNFSTLIDSSTGNPMNIFVEHSLVTNSNYNTAVFTDVSVGSRHYVDAGFTNYIPSEMLA